ncbi:MAG: GatB/YqeY domain-containing protein [Bacilli bacterium]
MLIDTIKKENMLALKTKDTNKRTVLSIVINKYMIAGYEAKANGKTLDDKDLISIIQKTVKELEEEKESYEKGGREEQVKNTINQIDVIKGYLPTLLSEEEIKKIILSLPDKSVPTVMKHFKTEYAGKCDMGLVNKVLRSLN